MRTARLNPEFRRNLWLEWNGHRVAFVCVVLASIFVLVSLFDPQGVGNGVARVALIVFVIVTMVWGAHRAGDAVTEELRDRTWDAQRMSALGPWSMTWGKLCGATVIPWFAGAICLVVYLVARQGPSFAERAMLILAFSAGAILLQGLNLIGALVGTHLEKHGRSTLTTWSAFGTLLLLAAYFSMYYRADEVIYWYGLPYGRLQFLTVSVTLLAAWIVFGAYRLMSTELSVATTPWAWTLFVVYLTIYFAGGYVGTTWPVGRALAVFAAIGLAVTIAGTYIAAFALYRDPLSFRRLASALRRRDGRRVFEEMPVWIASFLLALLFAIVCVALSFGPPAGSERVENVGITAIPIMLETVRNLLLLYYFTYGTARRRVETATIITIAIIAWLAPSIVESIGFVTASWALRPPLWERPLTASAILLVHVAVAGFLCVRRYRARVAPIGRERA